MFRTTSSSVCESRSSGNQKLRIMVRQHIDQTTSTRNFKARNDRIETEYWSKVTREEMSAQKEKWEIAFSGRQMDSVQKGDSCSFYHGSRSGQGAHFF